MLKDFELITIGMLITEKVIPAFDVFQINEIHLYNYIKFYGEIFSTEVCDKKLKTKSNQRFARKLAGLTLLKLNFERGATFSEMQSGIVYVIENEIFQEHYKIGMTIDLKSRLNAYQTYDPLRRFKVKKYDFVLNRVLVEKKILGHPDIFNEQGEWVKKQNALTIFEDICFVTKNNSGIF